MRIYIEFRAFEGNLLVASFLYKANNARKCEKSADII